MLRKLKYIFGGALLIVAALAIFSFQHGHRVEQWTGYRPPLAKGPAPATRSLSQHPNDHVSTAPSPATRPGAPARPAQQAPAASPATTPVTSTDNSVTFDTVVNVLNVVVGLLGIWCGVVGIRMQREAMAIHRAAKRES